MLKRLCQGAFLMDKIIQLLKEIGASDELAGAITEELQAYDREIHDKYQEVYKAKLQKAKEVCVEEVENHKIDLANKVSIFLESKSAQIEKRLEQQRAIEEGDAMSKLRTVREITENIEVASDAEIKSLKAKFEKLVKENAKLSEDKKRAEVAANRANEMALSIIRETKTGTLPVGDEEAGGALPTRKKQDKEEPEDDEASSQRKSKKEKAVSESVERRRSKSSKPKTTRRTLMESQIPAKKHAQGIDSPDNHIMEIAKSLDS